MLKFIGLTQRAKEPLLYYIQSEGSYHFLKFVSSKDGFQTPNAYSYVFVMDGKGCDEKSYNWKNVRISKQEHRYLITYTLNTKSTSNLFGALSINPTVFEKIDKIEGIKETATVISDYKYKDRYVMYFGEKNINIAFSSDLINWDIEKQPLISPRKDRFDHGGIEVGNAYVVGENIILTYYVKKQKEGKLQYLTGVALFNSDNPQELVWQAEDPILELPEELYQEIVRPLGALIEGEELVFYWAVGESSIFTVSCPVPSKHGLANKNFSVLFNKHANNPIISPRPSHPWESRATFNSAAIYEDGKVHFVYRALGESDLSVLGYATSPDGINIDYRSDEPIYIPREAFETPGQHIFKTFADHFASGGGYGGIEDPRITKIDNKFYMTYVAFDGANPPRVALTSISADDFLGRRWENWASPKLISAPGMVNKNAVIFPEKIRDKYVIFHRVYPNILIDYVDDLNFEDYLKGEYIIPPRKTHWDSNKIGAGAPPIKTDDGWLFIYQSVGYQDPHRYKIGAMLLAKDDPTKVICRTSSPIIEPSESYENEGFKSGVVYPCGAVVLNNNLNIYYGGADTVVCAASTDLDRFIFEMKHDRQPKLKKINSTLLN